MASKAQPGDSSERLPIDGIVEILGGEGAVGVFALCCAERLSVIAERLGNSPRIGKAVLAGLDLGWLVAAGYAPEPAVIDSTIASLDAFIGLDIGLGQFHAYVVDAIDAVIYALEAVCRNDLVAGANAGRRAIETHFRLAEDTWPGLSLAAYESSPLMHEEASRQTRDAHAISDLEGVMSPSWLADLRLSVHMEGQALVTLIAGEEKGPNDGPSDIQQTLF